MKATIKNGELLLSDLGSSYQLIRNWGTMRWDRKSRIMRGTADIYNLEKLIDITRGSVPESFRQRLERLKRRKALMEEERLRVNPVPNYIYPVKAKLYKHQIRGANMAMLAFMSDEKGEDMPKGFGLLMEMGLGKSLTAIAIMGALYKQGHIKRVLVVAPSTVCTVWPQELYEFADFTYYVESLNGDKGKKLKVLEKLTDWPFEDLLIAVINYESTFREGIKEALEDYDADLIICDESQRIKTHTAKQSKELHRLGDRARYKLILTGTPIQNNAVDFYSQYRFLDSRVFGTNFYAYRNRYCIMGGYQKYQIVGYRHMDELITKAHSIAFRATKAECLDLPEQTFMDLRLDFEPADKKIYDRLKTKSVTELESGDKVVATTVLTKLLRLQQMTGGFASPDEGKLQQVNSLKLDALYDIVNDYVIEGGQKLVVFARFRAELSAISDMLLKNKVGFCMINGDTPMQSRGEYVEDFQKKDEIQVFVAQLQTANYGITLTAASTAVFYSWDYNYASYSQACARIHRIGQENKCTYIHLIVNGTIDDKVLKAINKKEDIANKLVDNWRDYFE